jgi:hypothetical protein
VPLSLNIARFLRGIEAAVWDSRHDLNHCSQFLADFRPPFCECAPVLELTPWGRRQWEATHPNGARNTVDENGFSRTASERDVDDVEALPIPRRNSKLPTPIQLNTTLTVETIRGGKQEPAAEQGNTCAPIDAVTMASTPSEGGDVDAKKKKLIVPKKHSQDDLKADLKATPELTSASQIALSSSHSSMISVAHEPEKQQNTTPTTDEQTGESDTRNDGTAVTAELSAERIGVMISGDSLAKESTSISDTTKPVPERGESTVSRATSSQSLNRILRPPPREGTNRRVVPLKPPATRPRIDTAAGGV